MIKLKINQQIYHKHYKIALVLFMVLHKVSTSYSPVHRISVYSAQTNLEKNSIVYNNGMNNKYFIKTRYNEERVFHKSDAICSNKICQDGIFKWHASKTKNIYVGGIFPMVGGWPGGQSCLPSAIMALNEVNLNSSILPNYRVNLNWFNSEVGIF